MAKESNKPFEGWTEADFAADAQARKEALAGVASQMEAELAASMQSHEPEAETEKTE